MPNSKSKSSTPHNPSEPGKVSPDAPISVWIAGEFRAVELTRRLSRGGLTLKQDEDGNVFLVHADREHPPTTEARAQLFEAQAIIESARLALASNLESKDVETAVSGALQAAWKLIDDAANDLAVRS